eukprot:5284733-Prymnesium_polylepis.1
MTSAQIRTAQFTEHRHRAQDARGGGKGHLSNGRPAPAHAQIRAQTSHERSHPRPIAVKECQSPCPVNAPLRPRQHAPATAVWAVGAATRPASEEVGTDLGAVEG